MVAFCHHGKMRGRANGAIFSCTTSHVVSSKLILALETRLSENRYSKVLSKIISLLHSMISAEGSGAAASPPTSPGPDSMGARQTATA